jgi:cytoskeleton protein RodZ
VSDAASPPQASPSAPAGPGATLRAAREKVGYSVQDMADALNLTARVVTDLEAERWDSLPAAAFARGYVRSYGKLLGLDGDALMAGYEAVRDPTQRGVIRPKVAAPPSASGVADLVARKPGIVISTAVGVAVVVVLVVLYSVWPGGATRPPPSRIGPATTLARGPQSGDGAARRADKPADAPHREASEPLAKDAVAQEAHGSAPAVSRQEAQSPPRVAAVEKPPSDSPTAQQRGAAAPSLAASSAAAPPTVAAVGSPPDVVPPVAAPARQPGSRSKRITPEGDDRIDLTFTEDCWVEVADDAGNSYGDLSIAGDSLELLGRAPFKVRLGNGPGATLAFNGQAIATARHTHHNVTSLVLDAAVAAQ